jgi:hypothetical protein
MKNKSVLMATILAVATVLAAGLTVLPSSVQEAQANPCATEETFVAAINSHCVFSGDVEIEEEEEVPVE